MLGWSPWAMGEHRHDGARILKSRSARRGAVAASFRPRRWNLMHGRALRARCKVDKCAGNRDLRDGARPAFSFDTLNPRCGPMFAALQRVLAAASHGVCDLVMDQT